MTLIRPSLAPREPISLSLGRRLPFWGWVVMAFIAALVLIGLDHLAGHYTGHWDNHVRRLQIEDLFHDGQWRDMTWPFIAMPEVYISHCSRVHDVPYWLMAKGLALVTSDARALSTTFAVMPLLYLAGFLGLSLACLQRLGVRLQTRGDQLKVLGLFLIGAMWTIFHFRPNSTDHHNLHALIFVAILWQALRALDGRKHAGLWIGGLSLLSLTVTLESIPPLFGLFAFLGLTALGSEIAERARRTLMEACTVMAVGAVPAAYVSLGGMMYGEGACDLFSAPYAMALMVAGAGVAGNLMAWPWLDRVAEGKGWHPALTTGLKLGGVGLAGCAGVAALLLTNPACAAGPYGEMDALIVSEWLMQVSQEKSLPQFIATEKRADLFAVAIGLSVMCAAALRWKHLGWGARLIATIGIVAGLASLLQVRHHLFLLPCAALLLPVLVQDMRETGTKALSYSGFIGLGLLSWSAMTPAQAEPSWYNLPAQYCAADAKIALAGVEPGIVVAPTQLSYRLLLGEAVVPNGHQLAQLGSFLTYPAKARILPAFLNVDIKTGATTLAPYDYLVVCRDDPSRDFGVSPLYAALQAGSAPAFLSPVAVPEGNRALLYRIRAEGERTVDSESTP